MGTAISMQQISAAIETSMEGFELDGISLPKDARVLTDVLGEMRYFNRETVELESLPEQAQETIRKYIHE